MPIYQNRQIRRPDRTQQTDGERSGTKLGPSTSSRSRDSGVQDALGRVEP